MNRLLDWLRGQLAPVKPLSSLLIEYADAASETADHATTVGNAAYHRGRAQAYLDASALIRRKERW